MSNTDLIIDAVLGIGQKEALKGKQGELFQDIVDFLNSQKIPIAAVDIPTGMSSETGEVFDMKRCLKADITVTFLSKKTGFVKSQNKNLLGEIFVTDYGFTIEKYYNPIAKHYENGEEIKSRFFELADLDALIPNRKSDIHKYELPVVSVVGGYSSMEGAGELNCRAALSAGAGIVKQFTDSPKPFSPEIMRTDVGDKNFDINTITNKATAILVGSGMKQDEPILQKLVNFILSENINKPLVLDASAIGIADIFSDQPVIITPHIGEAKTFFKAGNELNKQELLDYLIEKSLDFTCNTNNIVVLKSDCTYIIGDDKIIVDSEGGPELATPGSGDVLAGLIASIIFYHNDMLEGVAKAVRLHSLAGQIAKEKMSEHSVLASDIIDAVPNVLNNNNGDEL
jgi:NAD(P)H-hydrate epimerase